MCFTFLFFTILFMKTIGCYHNLWAHISVAQDQVESNNFFPVNLRDAPGLQKDLKTHWKRMGHFQSHRNKFISQHLCKKAAVVAGQEEAGQQRRVLLLLLLLFGEWGRKQAGGQGNDGAKRGVME